MEDRFLKRLRKKARRGMRGWPAATTAFYGPNLDRATKVAVGIVPAENAEVGEMQSWQVEDGDVRTSPAVAEQILEFIQQHGALTVVMTAASSVVHTRKASTTKANGVRCVFSGTDATGSQDR